MRITTLKRSAKEALKGNWGIAIGVCVLYTIITSVIPNASEVDFTYVDGPIWLGLSLIQLIAYVFVAIPLATGLSWFYLDLYDRKPLEVKLLFAGFKNYWKVIGVTLLVSVFTFLWSLLFIIPGIIKGISYAQAIFIVKDNPEIGVLEAITQSRKMMDGYKWKYFLTNLSFIGWIIIPVLFIIVTTIPIMEAVVVGTVMVGIQLLILLLVALLALLAVLIYLIPYLSTTLAAFYRELTK